MQFWSLVPANPCVLLRGVQYGLLGTPESELAVLTHVSLYAAFRQAVLLAQVRVFCPFALFISTGEITLPLTSFATLNKLCASHLTVVTCDAIAICEPVWVVRFIKCEVCGSPL